MIVFRSLKIKQRILAQLFMFAVGLLVVSMATISAVSVTLYEEKATNLQFIVEAVSSLFERYHQQYLDGELALE